MSPEAAVLLFDEETFSVYLPILTRRISLMDAIGIAGIVQRDRNALGQAHAKHPDWPAPNYVDPQTRVPLLIGVSCAAGGLMIVLIAIRLYTRGVLAKGASKRGLGLDDWMMTLAAVFAIGLVIDVCICARYGTGYHEWDLRPWWSPHWGKATFVQNLALVLAATLTKVSVLLTYLYVFPQRHTIIFCWTSIAFIGVFGAANIIVTCLQCTPISSYWDNSVEKKGCIDINAYLYSAGAINSLTDVVVYLWPSRTLFELNLPLARRFGLCFTFAAGLVAVVASVARLISIHNASYSDDSTYAGTFIALWKVLEITFGVICGCLPAVKPIIKPLLPKALTSSRRARTIPETPYDQNNFSKLSDRRSRSYGDVDLDPIKHPYADRALVKNTTTVVGGLKQGSDSEEHIMERCDDRYQDSRW